MDKEISRVFRELEESINRLLKFTKPLTKFFPQCQSQPISIGSSRQDDYVPQVNVTEDLSENEEESSGSEEESSGSSEEESSGSSEEESSGSSEEESSVSGYEFSDKEGEFLVRENNPSMDYQMNYWTLEDNGQYGVGDNNFCSSTFIQRVELWCLAQADSASNVNKELVEFFRLAEAVKETKEADLDELEKRVWESVNQVAGFSVDGGVRVKSQRINNWLRTHHLCLERQSSKGSSISLSSGEVDKDKSLWGPDMKFAQVDAWLNKHRLRFFSLADDRCASPDSMTSGEVQKDPTLKLLKEMKTSMNLASKVTGEDDVSSESSEEDEDGFDVDSWSDAESISS